MKVLGIKLYKNENIEMYDRVKQDLEETVDEIEEGNGIRSRCQWHKNREKSNQLFLNLGKKRGISFEIGKLQ